MLKRVTILMKAVVTDCYWVLGEYRGCVKWKVNYFWKLLRICGFRTNRRIRDLDLYSMFGNDEFCELALKYGLSGSRKRWKIVSAGDEYRNSAEYQKLLKKVCKPFMGCDMEAKSYHDQGAKPRKEQVKLSKDIRVTSWNCGGLSLKVQDTIDACFDDVDVLCLQETWKKRQYKIGDFEMISGVDGASTGLAGGGHGM